MTGCIFGDMRLATMRAGRSPESPSDWGVS